MANILLCSVCILVGALGREVNIDQGEIQKIRNSRRTVWLLRKGEPMVKYSKKPFVLFTPSYLTSFSRIH